MWQGTIGMGELHAAVAAYARHLSGSRPTTKGSIGTVETHYTADTVTPQPDTE